MKEKNLFIFGISGATWSVMENLISSGRLPNIKQLQQRGSWGILSSVKLSEDKHFRPQTAWPSLSTGCNPDRHGITQFYHTADNLRVPCLWDFYQQRGLCSGLFWWPMTWPPSPINGFIIPAHFARDAQTWPDDLADIKALDRMQQTNFRDGAAYSELNGSLFLARLFFQRLIPFRTPFTLLPYILSILAKSDIESRSLVLRQAKLSLGQGIFSSLYRKYHPDLSMFCTFLVDFASHGYWRYHNPELFFQTGLKRLSFLNRALSDSYERVDSVLGNLLKLLPPESTVAVVSEHGMSPEIESCEVGLSRYCIKGDEVKRLCALDGALVSVPIARWIAYRYVNKRQIGRNVAQRLSQIKVVQSGKPLFNVHCNGGREVIIKFNLRKDILEYKDKDLSELSIYINGRVMPFLSIARKIGPHRSAMHDQHGVFLISGPRIRKNSEIITARIIDIVPTLLASVGIKTTATFDGTILDVFS